MLFLSKVNAHSRQFYSEQREVNRDCEGAKQSHSRHQLPWLSAAAQTHSIVYCSVNVRSLLAKQRRWKHVT